jgi:hypothetical protein
MSAEESPSVLLIHRGLLTHWREVAVVSDPALKVVAVVATRSVLQKAAEETCRRGACLDTTVDRVKEDRPELVQFSKDVAGLSSPRGQDVRQVAEYRVAVNNESSRSDICRHAVSTMIPTSGSTDLLSKNLFILTPIC